MKGVILHGGAGTRLRPLTYSGPKQLIPVANKPVSQYVLEDLLAAGVREVAIILGETYTEQVQMYYGDGTRFGARITYIHQGKPLGIAHAVGLCREFVGREPFIVYLGDNLLQKGVRRYLHEFIDGGYDVYILLKEVEEASSFGVARFDEDGRLVGLVEKPRDPPSKYALVGVYLFRPVIFEFIERLRPSWRGELEITDALQAMLESGCRVGYSILEGWWLDTGKKDDILQANMLILDERVERRVDGELVDSRVEGRVTIETGTRVVNSVVRGPTIIGSNCLIQGSQIGPYTSIGDGVTIKNSVIEHCVILEKATIEGVSRLEESLIGRNARISKNKLKGTVRLNIGDHSAVEI
ncbi:MAG: glucose-1-phosphate thymidylyltransferase [Candidatus Bathyarchaeia archaeon]|nr:glucose-1-phosphate thymidylyltransferase [Candidatus Bathyarchaeota archaeon]